MFIAQAIPGIWVYTTMSDFNSIPTGRSSPFLTPEQQARVERIRQSRLLFDGKHHDYFVKEQRSQFEYPAMRIGYRLRQIYIPYNLLGLISWKGADLLFGEEPLLHAEDDRQQAALQELAERSQLHQLFYACAVDCSYEAETFIEACMQGGEAYLKQVPADEIFPIGPMQADGQFARYDRFNLADIGTGTGHLWILLTTSYLPGQITRTLRQLDDKGKPVKSLNLTAWPLDAGEPPLEEVTATGITRNTITWVPNQLVRGVPVSDYDGAIELQDELNAKQTQIAVVLAKHANPKIYFPTRAADAAGDVRATDDAFFGDSPEDKPEYIVWKAELEAATKDRDFTRDALLMRTEMSPILLGIKQSGAHAEAFKTVRVQAYNSVTKAQRKASFWKNGIRRCVEVAQELEGTEPGFDYDRNPIGVELRDGLPVDGLDQATRQSILVSSRLMSRRRALTEQLNDPAAVETELTELEEEDAAGAIAISLNRPPAGGEEQGSEGPALGDGAAADAEEAVEVGKEVAA